MIDSVKTFHGLIRVPFCKSIGTNHLFESSALQEIIARLEMALSTDSFAVISGPSGCGKSSALRKFSESLDSVTHPSVYISCEKYKIGELSKQILSGLKIKPPFHGYVALSSLKKEIEKRGAEKNAKTVIILDEAQELPIETLLSLKNLSNYEMDSKENVLIVLCGHNELLSTLVMDRLDSLCRRIRIRYRVGNPCLEEITKYIKQQMKRCGATRDVFSDDAIATIYNSTKGNISLVNNICFEAIIISASQNTQVIGPGIVEKTSTVP